MAEEQKDYRAHAGYVLFPRSPGDLTSVAACPACFTPIDGPTCRVCGLDLAHPAAAELAALSQDAAALLDRRLDLIGRIRYETEPAGGERPSGEPSPPERADAAPGTPQASPPARRSGVQVVLLVVGVALLSVAAIFFLVYAFIVFGLVARTAIVGTATIASIAAAVLLRRRLPATAEGIAALSVVLVHLDIWAIQANDFFAAGSADSATYWGSALVLTGAIGIIWARFGGPRAWGVAGAIVIGTGLGLLVGRLADRAVGGWAPFAFAAALALSGVIHRVVKRPEQRAILLCIGGAGMVLTSIGVVLMPVLVTRTAGENLVVALVLAAVGTANVVAAGASARTTALLFASAAAVAPALVLAGRAALLAAAGLGQSWSFGASDTLIPSGGIDGPGAVAFTSLVALVLLIAGLVAAGRWSIAPLDRPFGIVIAVSSLLVLAGGVIEPIFAEQACWTLVGLAALVLGIVLRRRLAPRSRLLAGLAALVPLGLSYCVGWATLQTWQGPTVLAIAALILVRMLLRSARTKAATLLAAIVLLVVCAGAGARALALPLRPGVAADAVNAAHATGFISILLLGAAAYIVGAPISTLDRRVAFWLPLGAIAVSTAITQILLPLGVPVSSLLLPEYVTSLLVSLFLIAALASWAVSAATAAYAAERAAAVGALPVALALLVDGLARTIGVESVQRAVAIVLVLSVAHLAARLSSLPHRRVAAGSAIVTAAAAGLYEFAIGELTPLEWATVPVGLALIATGALHLVRTPEARSWAWLAPGTAMLLLPSLIATAFDRPLWRLVALGVTGVAIIVVAAVLRLQAPLVLASVVVLVHAVATFAPQIRAVYELVEWWVWIAIGGAILLALSIRFEATRRGVSGFARRIGALR